ncbi:MAG: T9SS type B sorting domain-containing protein [Bacteroidales bacterium]
MKLSKSLATALMTLLLSGAAAGQDEIQPVSPVLDIVTVDPATGFAELRWLSSVSPDVGSYVVYTYSGGTATAIDTIRSPFITTYTHTASAARYRSVTYVVAAVDSSQNISPLSNPLSTVWLSALNDECTGKITVTWTPYVNLQHPAVSQTLHIRLATGTHVADEDLTTAATLFEFTGYEPDTEYCFHITVSDSGGPLSSSNRSCVTTGSEVPPSWVSLDAIAVKTGGLEITGSYDQATDMVDYRLQRYNSASASWEQAAVASGSAGTVHFTVPGADTSVISIYRISAVNGCGLESTQSGSARNMVPVAELSGTLIGLRWNKPVPAGAELFSVWRNTGEGLQEVASTLSDTVWSEDYSVFANEVTASEVLYRVTAVASSAPAGFPVHSSSAAIIGATENIYMPNAFTPGRGGENTSFRPEFSFMPEGYDFRIYSRNGALIFRTTDHGEGWDGNFNGSPMPPGVYLWRLSIVLPSGRTEIRNGTVTILP